MADDNVRQFPSPAEREALKGLQPQPGRTPETPLIGVHEVRDKLGVYPLAEDVIVSKSIFLLVLTTLESGTQEQRDKLVSMLRLGFEAPWAR